MVKGLKVQRSISIDKDLDDKLKEHPEINVSAVCNKFLTEYMKENKK